MPDQQWRCRGLGVRMLVLVAALLAAWGAQRAAAAPTKWTIFVYMLADNNLEQYGLYDLEEIMAAMVTEPPGCGTTACGGSCGAGLSTTYSTDCAGGRKQLRCCPLASYPDVLVLVDKGRGVAMSQHLFPAQSMGHADYTLLDSTWSTAKLLRALPGGQWETISDYGEINMAAASTVSDFLRDGLRRYPPDGVRKYMVVFWDHGNGWLGYGADGTCRNSSSYQDHAYCDAASVQTLLTGISAGVAGVQDPTSQAPFKFDIIGFDACLMAMYEVGAALSPVANYMLASELLEPGTGWDYSYLGYLPLGQTAANTPVSAAAGFSERELAELLITGYMATPSTGLTLALTDLRQVASELEGSMSSLSTKLTQDMASTQSLAITLLRQRTLLGYITDGGGNVDLGALLARLSAATTGPLKARADAALAAYRAVVVSFQRDGELADGTGMAIYFPEDLMSMDARYGPFVSGDTAALSAWLTFLQGLYSTTASLLEGGSAFAFQEPYAVPYKAVAARTWVTHGTLSSVLGLSASLMYGFISPAGSEFIVAGSTVGRIAERAALGAWSGQLWGLVQDLTPGDGAVDALALAYADEQRITDSDGNVQQLILQMQVYHATSCYASTSEMRQAVLKYVYDMASDSTTLQLFSATGLRGEIPTAQGGVVIPYLGSIELSGSSTARSASFGYADCLKWGYRNSIMVAAFNASQAAGILGLDLTRDLATLLTATAVDGRMRNLYGVFQPAQKTRAGCQCSQLWSFQNASNLPVQASGQCVNPLGDALAWCQYEPDSCTGSPTKVNGVNFTDFCEPSVTLSGCKCHPNWSINGTSHYGSCANTGDPRGSWCVVDRASCGGVRAHEFSAANTTQASVNGSTAALTGLDFDYCQVTTRSGCHCSNAWEYGGTRYNGTCRAGLSGGLTLPGIGNATNWCFVDKACRAGHRLDGFMLDVCDPEGGRVTEGGVPCQLPAVYNGVRTYDCISYNHSAPGQRTRKPWCFTDQGAGQWGYCAPWTCSAALRQHCPVGEPAANLTGWAQPACLETLCNARLDLVNITLCTQDSAADKALLQGRYSTLAASDAFGQLLSGSTGGASASLDAYCTAAYGQLCMDNVLDPACPGLFRESNVWKATTAPAQLCDMGCLTALCRLQAHNKRSVTGTPTGVTTTGPPAVTCADDELTTQVMWSLMRLMDTTCGWRSPTMLSCSKVLGPTQQCAAATALTAVSGAITDGAPAGGSYSAGTACSWTFSSPDKPYIILNFSRLDTERMYDVVTVEDLDGVIGMFSGRLSGADIPTGLTTDTGLLRINFTADGSLQGDGFAANYSASTTPQVFVPTCASGHKLLQVILRSRDYASEMGWVITKRQILDVFFANTPSDTNIVMAGGTLPQAAKTKLPFAVARDADAEYKDYRSYYRYTCLPVGGYNLFTYDSYGDGWSKGRITLTQVFNATRGCTLVAGAAPAAFNRTTAFAISADAETSNAACGALTSPDGAYEYVEAGLVLLGEDTNTFMLTKQRKMKEALAILLDVDAAQVSIQSIANATAAELQTGLNSTNTTGSSRSSNSSGGGASSNTLGVTATRGADDADAALRRLQAAADTAPAAAGGHSRVQGLSTLAVSVPQLVASGVLDATERQLLQAEQHMLVQHQPVAPAARIRECIGSIDGCGGRTAARSLQQLLTLDDSGAWQNGTAVLDTPSTDTPGHMPGPDALNATSSGSSPALNDTASIDSSNTTITTAGASGASSSGGSSSDGTPSDVPALMPVDPLGPSAGATPVGAKPVHSLLVSQLQQQQGLVVVLPPPSIRADNRAGQGKKYAHVAVRWSPRDAFVKRGTPPAPAPLPQPQSGRGGGDATPPAAAGRDVPVVAAVPKPEVTQATQQQQPTVAASEQVALAPGNAAEPMAPAPSSAPQEPASVTLPFASRAHTQLGADNHTTVEFSAFGSGRTLQQSGGGGGGDGARSIVQLGPAAAEHRRAPNTLTINPAAVSELLQAGRLQRSGRQPRARTARRPAAEKQAPTHGAALGVQVPLPRPDEALVALAAADPIFDRQQEQAQPHDGKNAARPAHHVHQRQLLQASGAGSPTKGVAVVMRISGYDSSDAAAAASNLLSTVVRNGSLASTLAAQGWPGASVGLLYVNTGSVGGLWDQASFVTRLAIAVSCGVAGGVAALAAIWCIRRRRRAGAARMPHQQQQGPGGPSVVGPRASSAMQPGAARMSAAALYLPPQQAAGRVSTVEGVLVYPAPQPGGGGGAYSRSASPSAPMLLTPHQQAALAARQGAGSPLGQRQLQQMRLQAGSPQGGRSSIAAAMPGYPVVFVAPAGPGASLAGPPGAAVQPGRHFMLQQHAAMPVHPAPGRYPSMSPPPPQQQQQQQQQWAAAAAPGPWQVQQQWQQQQQHR